MSRLREWLLKVLLRIDVAALTAGPALCRHSEVERKAVGGGLVLKDVVRTALHLSGTVLPYRGVIGERAAPGQGREPGGAAHRHADGSLRCVRVAGRRGLVLKDVVRTALHLSGTVLPYRGVILGVVRDLHRIAGIRRDEAGHGQDADGDECMTATMRTAAIRPRRPVR